MVRGVAKVEVNDRIPAPLERVWALVSDFTGMVEALGIPYTAQGEGIGMTRTLTMSGTSVTERLEELDEATHTTSYSILESPFPLSGYQAWIALEDAGEGTTAIRWWSEFEPVGDEQAAADLVRGIYAGGIAGITKVLAQ
jgi:ligand-binding SRPBCC domain-containing protein